VYLGPWPNHNRQAPPETRNAHDRLISEWLANGRRLPSDDPAESATIDELILSFWRFAERHYRNEDGNPTNELNDYRLSLRPLRELYGTLRAAEFSPLKLKAVRQRMIDATEHLVRSTDPNRPWEAWVSSDKLRPQPGCAGAWKAQRGKNEWLPVEEVRRKPALCRGVINQRVARIVRMFKWGVSEELVSATVFEALKTVRGLERGRSEARESEPVKPVADAEVEATLPFMLPTVAAMVQVQRLTGARPGEVCLMRGCDLDTTGDVWLYRPHYHKTRHRGKDRIIAIGPRAQQVIKPFLQLDTQAYLFSPREAIEEKRRHMRANRKSKVQPSQVSRKRRKPKRRPGERYTTAAYGNAVRRACERAGVENWHVHQLRHTHATEVRRRFGLEAAQVALGHAQANVTEIYAERNVGLAVTVAQQIG
jgi:integrase